MLREICFRDLLEEWMHMVGRSPHPGVDSLAPARSALRAFGSAEFLSLLPKQLKSPPGEGECVPAFWQWQTLGSPGMADKRRCKAG
jgi:hypothetical protein